jgi:hypothetical protein
MARVSTAAARYGTRCHNSRQEESSKLGNAAGGARVGSARGDHHRQPVGEPERAPHHPARSEAAAQAGREALGQDRQQEVALEQREVVADADARASATRAAAEVGRPRAARAALAFDASRRFI